MILAGAKLAPAVIGVRCHHCQQFHSRYEVLRIADRRVVMCWRCYEKHVDALMLLAGQPPKGCQECHRSFREVADMAGPDGNFRFVAVPKDGIYQVLCGTCADLYLPKRVELFKGTPFGFEHLNTR